MVHLAQRNAVGDSRRPCYGAAEAIEVQLRALLILSLFFTGQAFASSPDGVDPELTVEEMTLANGLRVLLVPWPQRPTVAAGWVVRVGSAADPAGQSGLAHMLEHLLFRGTRTLGTRDWDAEEGLIWERDLVRRQILTLEARKKSKRKNLEDLRRQDEELSRRLAQVRVGGEQARLYTEAGALGFGAFTERDFVLSFVTVPANKLELWFWIESDRLLEPVFRDTEEEVQVVLQEIQQRVEADPRGPLLEELDALFWSIPSYGRPIGGRPGELALLRRPDVERHFQRHFKAHELTAVLVGSFDPAQARSWAGTYFGRLEAGERSSRKEPPEPTTVPKARVLDRDCQCSAELRVLVPTVAFTHPDAVVLDALAGLLNGPTGRLHRSLVLDGRMASSAWVEHKALRKAGRLTFAATALDDSRLQALEAAWWKEVQILQDVPVPGDELQKMKNQVVAEGYRRMAEPSALMMRLLIYEALGDWRYLLRWARDVEKLEASNLQQGARSYLVREKSLTARFQRQKETRGGQ